MDFINWIENEVSTNQFFSAALGGSLFYSVFGYVRSILYTIYHKSANLFIREITVSSYESTDIYNQLLDFVSSRIKHPKNIQIKTCNNKGMHDIDLLDDDELDVIRPLRTAISYGPHWFWYNFYTYVYLTIRTEEHHADTKSDIMNIKIYSLFSRKIRKEIGNLFITKYEENANISSCYEISSYGPEKTGQNNRQITSVFIDSKIKAKILDSIHALDANREIYKRSGINRTMGIMLYGKPGTGKTSYILALAKLLNRSVYYVDLSTAVEQKIKYLKSIKPNSFLVFEDIDAIPSFRVRDDKSTEQKDLGKLLKILDGTQLPDNTIVFATTNYIDKIDPAVKRYGRFDLHFEFEYADRELAKEMITYIDPSKINLLDSFQFPISQAEIQAKILKVIKGSDNINDDAIISTGNYIENLEEAVVVTEDDSVYPKHIFTKTTPQRLQIIKRALKKRARMQRTK